MYVIPLYENREECQSPQHWQGLSRENGRLDGAWGSTVLEQEVALGPLGVAALFEALSYHSHFFASLKDQR